MASLRKTKWFVATGIAGCVMGLAFVAMNGAQALSQDGSPFIQTGYSMADTEIAQCVAMKGSANCLSDVNVAAVVR